MVWPTQQAGGIIMRISFDNEFGVEDEVIQKAVLKGKQVSFSRDLDEMAEREKPYCDAAVDNHYVDYGVIVNWLHHIEAELEDMNHIELNEQKIEEVRLNLEKKIELIVDTIDRLKEEKALLKMQKDDKSLSEAERKNASRWFADLFYKISEIEAYLAELRTDLHFVKELEEKEVV